MKPDLTHLLDREMLPIRLAFLDNRANLYRPFLRPQTARVLSKAIFDRAFAGSTDPAALSHLAMLCMICQPLRILELGTYYGFSTLVLADLLSSNQTPGRVVSVDPAALPQENARQRVEEAGLSQVVEFVRGSSTDATTLDTVQQHAPYDLIYIDSSHEYDATIEELETYLCARRMIRPGGIAALHDITLDQDEEKGVGEAAEDWISLHPEFRYLPLTTAGIWPNACGFGLILAPS